MGFLCATCVFGFLAFGIVVLFFYRSSRSFARSNIITYTICRKCLGLYYEPAIMVHSHEGPRGFGDMPGCFFEYWFSCKDSIRENVVQYNGGALLLLGLKCLFELSSVRATCVFGFLVFVIVVLLSCGWPRCNA